MWSTTQMSTTSSEFSVHAEGLSLLQNTAVIGILEEAFDQIAILGTSDDKSLETEPEMFIECLEKRAKKYIRSDNLYNPHNAEPFTHTVNKMKFTKLQVDRVFIQEILKRLIFELREYNNFTALTNYLTIYHNADTEEQNLISEESKNVAYVKTLKEVKRGKRENNKIQLQTASGTIAKLKDDIETTLFDDAVKTRYVENWENARIEQSFLICDQNETELLDTINKYKNEIEKELRIHSEIESYIAENLKDLEEGIEVWQKRYEVEIEEKTIDIQTYKDKREDQAKRFAEMTISLAKHAQEIIDWLEYKERKRIEDEIFEEQTAAAIIIQAWWRGTMVRKQLGPFNPNPKKKRGKKGKGKGKDKGKGKKGGKKKK